MIIHDMEQGTPEWLAMRLGKPTASEFKSLVTSTGKDSTSLKPYAQKLAAELYAGAEVDNWGGNAATERGHELEPIARDYYVFMTDRHVQQVGFITDSKKRYGCSPDSLVDATGMLEIKCCKQTAHMKNLMYFTDTGKVPTDYVSQAQGQLFVARRRWVDLLFYHPQLRSFWIRITPIRSFHLALSRQLRNVIAERDRVLAVLERD